LISLPLMLLLTSTLGALLAGFVCSTTGVFVVRMGLSSIGFCMSHAAFAGAAFGMLISIDPMLSAIAFASVTALLLGPLSEKSKLSAEVITGVMFSLMIALAFLFLSLSPGAAASATALRILWGSIFAISWYDILYLGLLAFVIMLFVVLFYKEILAMMFDRKMAESSGINTKAFFVVILFLTGFAVALSLKLVGGLLVFALIVNPTSTAYQFFYDFRKIIVFSPLVGISGCLAGFLLSLQFDFPIGASIVIVSALVLAVAIAVSPKRRRGRVRVSTAA
jgi:ABC-type Mn2+/Zn2+ transport system permease subunit